MGSCENWPAEQQKGCARELHLQNQGPKFCLEHRLGISNIPPLIPPAAHEVWHNPDPTNVPKLFPESEVKPPRCHQPHGGVWGDDPEKLFESNKSGAVIAADNSIRVHFSRLVLSFHF